jgi:hypothetical protein
MPELIKVPLTQLIPAKWNYKRDDPDAAAKLVTSIKQDHSAGVPVVRWLNNLEKYEVIDGNHRLIALQRLAERDPFWQEITVENFGEISDAKAVLISRRRNHDWFTEETALVTDLMVNTVIPEFPELQTIAPFMPETAEELKKYYDLSHTNWSKTPSFDENSDLITIKVIAPRDESEVYFTEMSRIKRLASTSSDWTALKYICVNSSQTPEESFV